MAEPARTRRSSRRRTEDFATPLSIEVASPAAPADVPAAPLSRRALRERQRAVEPVAAPNADETETAEPEIAADPVVVDMAKTVVAATEIVVETVAEAAAEPSSGKKVKPEPAATESGADAFTAASRAFRAVAGAPSVPQADTPIFEQKLPTAATAVHTAPRRSRVRRKLVATGATVGIMGIAGLLAVSMTLPAEAVAAAQGVQPQTSMSLVAGAKATESPVSDEEIQAYVASGDVQNDTMHRSESFSTASLIDLATEQGIKYSNAVYTNDPDASIQWPFVVGVAMSSGYGMRDTGMHEGIDLVPGAGAPVQAIADGTVRIATESGGNYGVTVYIDHVIDGKLITSHYSHMQYGSLQVSTGQTVKVGDVVGKVGNTGRSYGAHLHFELIVNGSTINPLPWLQSNAGRYDGVSPVS
ncbi:M23 family metallopeptidase [Microbacterium abyssi]|uniref:M23 family metallopeptidase n=1 Tax=Microbacterium abyssi TaxID=2782166 RepID=UPI001E54A934|nr:M23 family metallopeptidase [Microbacterium sp. A18JL241]